MTNPSPQDPQNPIPEGRRRPIAGLTFDEMIAIFVAFTTIGGILFWSLGGRENRLATRLGFNKDKNLLSTDRNFTFANFALGNIGLGESASELDIAEVKQNQFGLDTDFSPESESVGLLASSEDNITISNSKPNSYKIDDSSGVVSKFAGVTASSRLSNNVSNNKSNLNAGNIGERPQVSTPKVGSSVGNQPKASTPDIPESPKNQPETPTAKPATVPDDITPSYWAYPFVKQMSDKALVPDFTDDHNFEPDKLITRADMATLISQAFEMEKATKGVKKFKDVTDKKAIADVDKAVRIGFMHGYSDNEFRPTKHIPRYQVLVALATGLGLEPSTNPEEILQKLENGTDIPDWAKKQVAAAAEAGLIVNRPGFGTNDLKPNEEATRGEVAAMIHQALVTKGRLQSLESEYILKP